MSRKRLDKEHPPPSDPPAGGGGAGPPVRKRRRGNQKQSEDVEHHGATYLRRFEAAVVSTKFGSESPWWQHFVNLVVAADPVSKAWLLQLVDTSQTNIDELGKFLDTSAAPECNPAHHREFAIKGVLQKIVFINKRLQRHKSPLPRAQLTHLAMLGCEVQCRTLIERYACRLMEGALKGEGLETVTAVLERLASFQEEEANRILRPYPKLQMLLDAKIRQTLLEVWKFTSGVIHNTQIGTELHIPAYWCIWLRKSMETIGRASGKELLLVGGDGMHVFLGSESESAAAAAAQDLAEYHPVAVEPFANVHKGIHVKFVDD